MPSKVAWKLTGHWPTSCLREAGGGSLKKTPRAGEPQLSIVQERPNIHSSASFCWIVKYLSLPLPAPQMDP